MFNMIYGPLEGTMGKPEDEGLVQCLECDAEGTPDEMIYQGKDGKEHTAPGSALDYYLCKDCEAYYQRLQAAEDYEGDDALLCKGCGLLVPPATKVCPVCLDGDELVQVESGGADG